MDDIESRTLWCGNLSDKVTEEILYELFLQAAPLEEVRIPSDKNGRKSNYGFVVVKHLASVNYVLQLLDGTSLYDRTLTIKPRKTNQNNKCFQDIPTLKDPFAMASMLHNPGHLVPQSPPYQSTHYDRQQNKPYHRRDNSNRHGYNHRNNHGNEWNRRRRY